MIEPKISIIIPSYNSEKTIERAINSVITQNYSNKEIIVVDDGSFDNTKTILSKYVESINIVTTENFGVSRARNNGIKNAVGDYIMFLDSDDYLLPDCLNTMMGNIDDSDILCCSFLIKNNFKTRNYCFDNMEMDQKQFIKKICKIGSNQDFMYIWGKLLKKSVVDEVLFPENIKIGEDVVAMIRATLKSRKIKIINKIIYVYDRGKSSVTRNMFSADYLDLYKVWDLIKKEFEEIDSDYVRYADINIWRLDYTVLARLFISDSKTRRDNIEILINANKRLKENHRKLLSSGIVLSRKLAIVLVLGVSEIYIVLNSLRERFCRK